MVSGLRLFEGYQVSAGSLRSHGSPAKRAMRIGNAAAVVRRARAIHCFQIDSLRVVMVPLKEFKNAKKSGPVIVLRRGDGSFRDDCADRGVFAMTRKQKQLERNFPHKLNCR